MASKLFVGSLSFNVDDKQLKELFASVGEVISASVISDRYSGQSKGFGFVEMSDDDAKEAIKQLNGKELDGRTIIVNVARPKEDKPRSSFGGGGSFNQNRSNSGGNRY